MGCPSYFLPIILRNLYKIVKILSLRFYPFRGMVWFNMALQWFEIHFVPPTGNTGYSWRVFPSVCFANANFPDERCQISFPKDKLSQLPENNRDISRRSNLDHHIDRADRPFCQGKYSFSLICSVCCLLFCKIYSKGRWNSKDS